MAKNLIIAITGVVLVLGLSLSSCRKGDTGPQGPVGKDGRDGRDGKDGKDGINGTNGTNGQDGNDGKDGINGTNGTNGQDGQDGQDGNANVKSQIVSVTSSDWIITSNIAYFDTPVAIITSSIANSGSVQVFMESSTQAGTWLNMPSIQYASGYFSTFNFIYGTGVIRIFKNDSDLSTPINPGNRTFRIVAIASSARAANPNVDWRDYSQVEKIINANFVQ